jgi:hypothetical protein
MTTASPNWTDIYTPPATDRCQSTAKYTFFNMLSSPDSRIQVICTTYSPTTGSIRQEDSQMEPPDPLPHTNISRCRHVVPPITQNSNAKRRHVNIATLLFLA